MLVPLGNVLFIFEVMNLKEIQVVGLQSLETFFNLTHGIVI